MTETIILERAGRVVTVRLNRPKALNALNSTVMRELTTELSRLDEDPGVGCFVITGSERAFAAGADISEMQPKGYVDMVEADFFAGWEAFNRLRTPKVAAVSGYALGGGCELAMMCDMIFAADSTKFGQPEIKLGVIPGIGGSQRLPRLVGRALAMDMILTGRMIDAEEALRAGLVSRVIPADSLIEEAQSAAQTIANYSKPAVMVAREAVARAEESSLNEGILFERRVFHALFATNDQKEGMAAFLEKRPPAFEGR
ncbi:enoyl-CoA hydratase [Pelagibius sp. Alg239-R121]|uniref:enoyl-CoA hydratase n=1 Tax=Pelagibius sp. Alg239-R121 TaxID=2993448 RepID=UPI0024A63C9F|nr:enoyl-CoA hydratase [Pelagibius sp. Alg239-R121]